VLALHKLVRASVHDRVAKAVADSRAYMQSHGGDVEFVRVEVPVAFVKLHGACSGCSMSSITLRNHVEDAVKAAAPEITKLEIVPSDPGPALILPEARDPEARAGWVEGPLVEQLREGRPLRLETPGRSVIVIRLGEKLSSFFNACPHQNLPIDTGQIDPETGLLRCPWHGWEFDALTGECPGLPACQLEPIPLRVEAGRVWIRPT